MWSDSDPRAVLIKTCALGARARNLCAKMSLVTLGDLTQVTRYDLTKSRCVGEMTVIQLAEVLAEHGLTLKGDRRPDERRQNPDTKALHLTPSMWLREFARDPRHHLGLPLWVLDLCPRTHEWLTERQLRTVLELVDCTRDDLWLLALAADLTLEDAVRHLEDVEARLHAFDLWLRPVRPAHEVFRLPSGGPEAVAAYRLDEYRVRAETIFRFRLAGIRTLGDLKGRSAELIADFASWPPEPAGEARALIDLIDWEPDPCPSRPGWNDSTADSPWSEAPVS
jgi:hypothetical protein